MKLLLDSCVWGGARAQIEAAGHDVLSARDWPEDPGDEEILARAHSDGRALVTLDKDFGELAIIRGLPHSGIVRLVGFSARQQGPACIRAIAIHGTDLSGGAILTVERDRIRIRPG